MRGMLKAFGGALVLGILLTACGGGGGASGSTDPSSGGGTAAPPEAQLTLKVTVNGAQAAPDASGSYAVKPGDTVAVTPSQASTWTSTSGTASAITLRNPSISGSQWASQLVNTLAATALYTVTASVGSTLSATAVFSVAAADARNGSYKVFATNGTQQTLTLNVDTKTYEMRENATTAESGSISEDPSATGTYIFSSSRITAVANTARFRVAQDTIVGAFPFTVTQAATTSYAVQPFVASRALETSASALDGVYNRFGIDVAPASASSTISQFKIAGSGTTLVRCEDNTIYRIDQCPALSLQSWTVSQGSSAGTWVMTEVANPSNYSTFGVARLGGEKIFLIAGKLIGNPLASVFRIGVTESNAWPTGSGYGSSTSGSWGSVSVQATTSTRAALAADGTSSTAQNTFGPMNALGPLGMREITNGAGVGDYYFAMQGAKLFAIVGADNPSTAGYLQLNLID
jgi:hypothetical protein